MMSLDSTFTLKSCFGKIWSWREPLLQSDNKEQLIQLAAQIAVEKDPKKFHALVTELNDLLQAAENRLNKQVDHSQAPG